MESSQMQAEGPIGHLVAAMIRRSVRHRFHTVYWKPPQQPPQSPVVFYANHHGWMDGYLMFHVAEALQIRCLDWIEEFDAFPLFRYIGGMPYAPNNTPQRLATIRKTMNLMNAKGRSLVIFPEGILHRPPHILPFGKSLATIARHVKQATFVPVTIAYELALHERPEAWITIGNAHQFQSAEDCRSRVIEQLQQPQNDHVPLVVGKKDVNERMSMKGVNRGR